MVPFAPVAMACEVTMIIPPSAAPGAEAVVVTVATYLVPERGSVCSQPQPSAAIAVPEPADWMVSVMLVRQEEAAKIASDILARAV